MHKDRRNMIAGDRKKEDDEVTLVGEEANAVKEVVEAAALKTEAEGVGEEVIKVVGKKIGDIKATDDVTTAKEVTS